MRRKSAWPRARGRSRARRHGRRERHRRDGILTRRPREAPHRSTTLSFQRCSWSKDGVRKSAEFIGWSLCRVSLGRLARLRARLVERRRRALHVQTNPTATTAVLRTAAATLSCMDDALIYVSGHRVSPWSMASEAVSAMRWRVPTGHSANDRPRRPAACAHPASTHARR
jgi:hypothetical protein